MLWSFDFSECGGFVVLRGLSAGIAYYLIPDFPGHLVLLFFLLLLISHCLL